MLTVGVDIHKKTLTICVLDESDKPVITKRIESTVGRVVEFFSDPAAMTILGKSCARHRVNCRSPESYGVSPLLRHGCGN